MENKSMVSEKLGKGDIIVGICSVVGAAAIAKLGFDCGKKIYNKFAGSKELELIEDSEDISEE